MANDKYTSKLDRLVHQALIAVHRCGLRQVEADRPRADSDAPSRDDAIAIAIARDVSNTLTNAGLSVELFEHSLPGTSPEVPRYVVVHDKHGEVYRRMWVQPHDASGYWETMTMRPGEWVYDVYHASVKASDLLGREEMQGALMAFLSKQGAFAPVQ